MADRIVKEVEKEEPRETVVVRETERPARRSSSGIILGLILLVIILLLLFGRGLFDGGGTNNPVPAPDTNVEINTPDATSP